MMNATGLATITVTVYNSSRSNSIVRQSFTVNVVSNQPPTLDPITNVSIVQNSSAQTIR